jgi:hypothetical protein
MANRYWVGGAGTWDSSSTTNWSTTSGGANGASAPTSADDVFFDQAGTYTVTSGDVSIGQGAYCRAITVSAGTVTFNVTFSSNYYFSANGNISIIAATLFTAPANGHGVINQASSGGALTCSFGSSGTNTQKVYFTNQSNLCTSYSWCTAATQTFHAFSGGGAAFTCAGSTITIDNQNRASSAEDLFILNSTTFSVAGTTINLGTATTNVTPNASLSINASNTVEPTLNGLNIVQVRDYTYSDYYCGWYNTISGETLPVKFGNLVFRGTTGSFSGTLGIYSCNALTVTNTSLNWNTSYSSGISESYQKLFSGAVTLNGSTFTLNNSLSILFSSTVTLTTSGTSGSNLNLTANTFKNVTFTGAVSMTGGTGTNSRLQLPQFSTVAFSSTLTSTAPTGIQNSIENGGSGTVTVAGNTSLTNTYFQPDGTWTQSGASTFLITSSPTSSTTSAINIGGLFTIGTGTTTITSTNSIFRSGFVSGGIVNVTGAATPSGITFDSYAGLVSFGAATISTWTDVKIDLSYFGNFYTDFIVNGAGGFSLTGTTKNSQLIANSLTNSTGPLTLISNNSDPNLILNGVNGSGFALQSGGVVTVTGGSGGMTLNAISGNLSFGGASVSTWTNVNILTQNITINGAGGFTLAGSTLNSGITANSLTNSTGSIVLTASPTNPTITFNGANGFGFAFQSGGLVTVSGAATASGIGFSALSGNVSFVAATLATWTDVNINVSGSFTVTGVGGFTLAGITKNSGFSAYGSLTVTGPAILNHAPGYSLNFSTVQGSSLITVSGASLPSGAIFNASSVSFVAATLATWTDVAVLITGNFTVTGAGGFTLAGATKNSGLNVNGAWSVTGPTTLNIATGSLLQVDSVTTGGGAFTANGVSGGGTIFRIVGSAIATSVFSSTLSTTNVGIDFTCTNLTFTGAVTITNPISISVYGATTTVSNALSITSTNLIDGIAGLFGSPTFVFYGNTLTTSSTATNWTFTNARIYFQFSNAGTITNPVILADNGGLYWAASNLTLNSALTSSGASKWNILLLKTYGATLTLKGAVTLVNCQLAATNIVVDGGATRNFAYSLSTPICNNTTVNTTEYYGSSIAQNYPEICVDSFTLSATGGTFSIAGGGSAIFRTLVRPYRAYAADPTTSSCTLTLPALTPTLTDVDFWRVTVAGAVTKPLTGTRLGNVGTITNITTATTKNVYWVGGAGAWNAAKWATASGGATSVLNYPLPQDNVIFDANSGTGAITYPASVRVKSFIVDAVPAGTTSVYCNATNATTSPSYLWVSGDINGPATTPTGTFVLGNDSSFTYNSFTSGVQLQTIVIADSSASDTHTINPINITFMQNGSMQFATLGTTTISGSITAPVWYINNYCSDAYTINITAAQIGSSSFDYSNSTAIIAIGTPNGLTGSGTVNYGACNIYTYSFYPSQLTSNTAYSVYIGALYAQNCTTLGNINFVGSPSASSTVWYMYVNTSVSCLSLNIKDYGSSGTSALSINGSAIPISMYAFTVTYNGSATGMLLYGSGQTFTKLGGGNVSVSGVTVNGVNASPANTWYTTGTVTSSTGWNAGAAPNSKGGFLLFQ